VSAPAGAPPLGGVVEWVGQPEWPELLVRLDEPAPGIADLVPHSMGGQVYLFVRLYLYGDRAPAAIEAAEAAWHAWIDQHFAMAGAEEGAA
jgi:hypothetical protein